MKIKTSWLWIAVGVIAADYLIAKSGKPGLAYYRTDPSSQVGSSNSFTRSQVAGPLSHAIGIWYPS